MINTKYRSTQTEEMDDFDVSGEILTKTLNQIATINKLLGGNAVTVNGVKKILKNQSNDATISIVDLGCGNGDMLRILADYGVKNGYNFQLLGVDANQHTLDYAAELSKNHPQIKYIRQDVLANDFEGIKCDIVVATLFMHHFSSKEIVGMLNNMKNETRLGFVINDLHRSKLAYYLYKLVTLPVKNYMVKKDGLISILRGFKRKDINEMIAELKCENTLTWKWAFRYQWIIKNK